MNLPAFGNRAPFADRVRHGDPLLGALLRMPNESTVELAGLVGLDFVVIDTEHGPGDQLALAQHINAATANGLATIVRVGRSEEVLRVLDLGADGILAPHISSIEQAREVVAAVHYPPLGRRGFAAYTRAGRYGLTAPPEHHARSRRSVVFAMIEDPLGLAAAAGIAAVEGIDGLMFGPADFATELGVLGTPDDPRVTAAATAVRAHAIGAGIAPVSIVGSPAAARSAFSAGDSVVLYNVAHALGGLFTQLASARPEPAFDRSGATAGPFTMTSPPDREPLVLLPGMLGDGSVWHAVAAELSDIAVPQFGRIDLDDSVGEMAASVLAVAPARFALAGHSLGAIVALEIARQAPERLTRLALVNASGRSPSDIQQESWAITEARIEQGEFADVASELARRTLPAARRQDPELLGANERMAAHVGEAGLRRQLRAQQTRASYVDGLGSIDVPVLVVSAALDEICPPHLQEEIATHCPRARLVTLSDAGHMSPLERPVALAGYLREWLTS